MPGTALVLGSGGITGTAWELGLLAGLARQGIEPAGDAAVLVGTSAGSVAGAQLAGDTALSELYERQLLAPGPAERYARIRRRARLAMLAGVLLDRRDPAAFARRLGRASRRATARGTVPTVDERLATIASRLPSTEWPQADLRIVALDADTGACRVFTRADGVPLVEAVAASCAVPGAYPAIPIGGRTYIDGGFRSGCNVDVARGCEPVLVLAPRPIDAGPLRGPQQQLDALGVRGVVIAPDGAARSAIGPNPLDPAARRPAAEAGLAQAARVAERVRGILRDIPEPRSG